MMYFIGTLRMVTLPGTACMSGRPRVSPSWILKLATSKFWA
jgi:hypothetical protein